MSETSQADCRRNSWLVALAGGALVALMLLFVAHYGFLKALVIGLIFFVALGAFLVWAFCSRSDVAAHQAVPAPQPAEPAPRPAAPAASAAPVAVARAPEPVAEPAPEPAKATSAVVEAAAKPRAAKAAAKPAKPAARKAAAKAPAAEKAATAMGLDAALAKSKDDPKPGEPEMLSAPRGGKADDLKMIKGVGPKLEALLNEVGVWHFDQIASWKAKDIAFVDEKMVGFHGRITRDEWVKQAKVLAKGEKTEFSARVAKGDVY
ncbi:endonuclease [Defluviimonas sp. SAOS-178_SWC]|uniref:endonuclease n=1 Tax=Defluviimonas sp. SAOS-178_SWC TaxID=3121287 RepID=UPI00322220ED